MTGCEPGGNTECCHWLLENIEIDGSFIIGGQGNGGGQVVAVCLS